MKFDVCIGNPPYHLDSGRRKVPIYNRFIMELTGDTPISNKVCLITPDGFIKGGKYLESCRDQMIENKHLKSVEFRRDDVFSGVAVNAAITYFDNNNSFDTINKTIVYPDKHKEYQILDWYYRDVIIDELKYKILKLFETKVVCENNMSKIISAFCPCADNFFNTNCFKRTTDVFYKERTNNSQLKCLVNEGGQDFYYINTMNIEYYNELGDLCKSHITVPNYYKVCFTKAGSVENKPLKTYILEKNDICIDKFLCIYTDTLEEAKNAEKYFSSKFYRAGLSSKLTSWNLYPNWHSNIPIQDFTNSSDIDWSKSSHEIDMQLYKKYNFTEDEIQAIEEYIK